MSIKDSIEEQLKKTVSIHLKAKRQELQGIINDIEEYKLTTVHQVVGLIQTNLDIVNNLIKGSDNE